MRRKNRPYTNIGRGVLVDDELLALLRAQHLRPVFDKKKNNEYAVIVNELGQMVDVLHRRLALLRYGPEKVHDDHYVAHHKNGNKKNNRYENIEMRLRGDHLRLHRLAEKKKIENEEHDVFGLWRPHEKSQVVTVDPDQPLQEREDGKTARESYSAPTMWTVREKLSLKEQLWQAGNLLEEAFDRLSRDTQFLDSGTRIPKTEMKGGYKDQDSKNAGVEPIRLGCFKSEAALVRACVKHRLSDRIFDMNAVSADVGIEVSVLTHIMNRPCVWLAIERWRVYRRLPKVCKPGWSGARPK
jgi:hypothetical protein